MKKWWMPSILLVSYVTAFAVNVGYFTWSCSVSWLQIVASAVYAISWIGCMIYGVKYRTKLWLPFTIGIVTTIGGVLGVLTRMLGKAWLTIPALLTAGVSVTPLYGVLSLIDDYDLLYMTAAVVGAVVCGVCSIIAKRIDNKQDL